MALHSSFQHSAARAGFAEDIVEQVQLVHADEHRLRGIDLSFDQCDLFGAHCLVEEALRCPGAAPTALESRFRRLLDDLVLLEPVGDQVADRADLEPVKLREGDEIVHPRHRPSSFMISQITPEGLSPARRATSTAASVWPARIRTPPSLATRGKTWPGVTICSGPLDASIATEMVRARSAAEMPVVTPSRASIEVVKAVRGGCRCGGSSAEAELIHPALRKRQADEAAPCLAMKLIASGVAIWAG
jgi:hypothetical protein